MGGTSSARAAGEQAVGSLRKSLELRSADRLRRPRLRGVTETVRVVPVCAVPAS